MYQPLLILAAMIQPPSMTDLRQAYYEACYEKLFSRTQTHPADGVLEMARSNTWAEREAASRRLAKADPRWAMRGYLSPDPEVRWRCDSVLVRRTRCYDCIELTEDRYWYTCSTCDSSRSTWLAVKE